jgi:hypothetical protein
MRFTSTAILALGLVASSALRADEEHACVQVQTSIVTSFIACPANFPSPVGLCTAGKVLSGLLQGDTLFRALSVNFSTGVYTGELVIKTRHGKVIINDTGNLLPGQFIEKDVIVHGTGRFEDATGTLDSAGSQTIFGFSGSLVGQICFEGEGESDHEGHDRE